MSVIVGRPINGITLNPLEYLLDSKNEKARVFKNQIEAEEFLIEKGAGYDDIDYLTFKDVSDFKCPYCGWPLARTPESDIWDYECTGCDRDFWEREVKKAAGMTCH